MGVFVALSSPFPREILALLRDGDRSAGEIAGRFTLTKATLSGHFAALREAGLVLSERRGNQIYYSLNLSAGRRAAGLMRRVGREGEGKWSSVKRA